MAKHIKILSGDSTSEILELDSSDPIYVDKGEKVTWSIKGSTHQTNVASFYIEEKENTEQIFLFLYRPPRNHTKNGGGLVNPFVRDGAEYEYSIHWIDSQGKNCTHDPKISVKPEPLIKTTIKVIEFLLLSFIGYSTLKTLIKKRNSK